MDAIVKRAHEAANAWAAIPSERRREVLLAVANEMSNRRAVAIATLRVEANKVAAEADTEVSEAIDFARYYAEQSVALGRIVAASFEPLGAVVITSPWNFPYAIAAGGALAALAAGNAVILKPAPSVPGCAALVAECCWAAGVPRDVLQLAACDDGEVSRSLIANELTDAVILTGSFETAELFHSWRPSLQLFGETSGKNALVITPHADVDLAVSDLVKSAFGHAGQKCSAASLAICVGDIYTSKRFRRQLVDATQSLRVGLADNPRTSLSQLAGAPSKKLLNAFTKLDSDEKWLIKPKLLDADENLWSPGIKLGVKPGSSFHLTECFGPVLGLMPASSVADAVDIQNGSEYGLTAGIHTLDSSEIDFWQDRVAAGNLYVNRPITGAIVQRQPFGGWKRSSVGPGAKAGGPNYLTQFGDWKNVGLPTASRGLTQPLSEHLSLLRPHLNSVETTALETAARSDSYWWTREFSQEHDPAGLIHETNVLRYRPFSELHVRLTDPALLFDLARTSIAAKLAGVPLRVSAMSRSGLLGLCGE
ncbi:MAG: aldehyde dehydrogenase family protein, partial [Acidimicrobiales bacterium]